VNLPRVRRRHQLARERRSPSAGIILRSGGPDSRSTIRGHTSRGTGILNDELYVGELI
jgi:hypothetical protein